MEDLARRRCEVCTPGTPRLSRDEARTTGADLEAVGWRIGETSIERVFELRSFNAAFGLATRVALLAESQGHQPDLEIGWARLVVRFTTHAIGGLSSNDLVMAAKVERMATRAPESSRHPA